MNATAGEPDPYLSALAIRRALMLGCATVAISCTSPPVQDAKPVAPDPPRPTTLVFTPSRLGTEVGGSVPLGVQVRDQYGNPAVGQPELTIVSSDTLVAVVDAPNRIRPLKSGDCWIVVTARLAGVALKDSMEVVVVVPVG